MALILNLETATKNCSVALARDGVLVALREVADAGYAHAERLHVFIEECLAEAEAAFSDLDAIAVSEGPGSYTGLRIGVSAAKGLCYALGKPLIAVPTLEVLARAANTQTGTIVAMLDARRMEAYTAVFSADGTQLRETQPEILTPTSFADLPAPIWLIGDAQAKFRELAPEADFQFCEAILYPSATNMVKASFARYQNREWVDVAYFEPVYLKEFFLPGKS
ncbi:MULTISPECIES: tRNA (adenosine(37)-N6)-threonylcarbamoyltransferase complex dimerization subunit type 1 TsaB [unclassified Flavobacterium]|uniref:tRNA (adenosine(37)-N6)-threonylcarbamoyltransferase complex dimerization subunit type 1 TsaB n=1 Tax=unclassified Flavobacterium TaxID=196869 RepID=UPI001F12974B|nr:MULTISPECIES: tRNA (adenosine(37)-N6)-threonylcarbamoyltransferase complex dimerization subunit type 1 TsaB [unclassified Flavobacterium]UMY65988.1 tRNA (adenosine(37)-N6)-threonylcarbamoyltransferase complex dimerization subunit type 1 TsaB [Flavobacterium sp. HJ-32-4]